MTIIAKQAQNTALNPSISASGESLSITEHLSVTDPEITAITAILVDIPSCATVWYTAPASACVSSGKISVIIRLATVKFTKVDVSIYFDNLLLDELPSTEMGRKSIAQNAQTHHDQVGLIRAISSEEILQIADMLTT